MKKIVIAVDSFKGSMSSLEAGAVVTAGIRDFDYLRLENEIPHCGGEGKIVELLFSQLKSIFGERDASE